jgi:hypothetical protein
VETHFSEAGGEGVFGRHAVREGDKHGRELEAVLEVLVLLSALS